LKLWKAVPALLLVVACDLGVDEEAAPPRSRSQGAGSTTTATTAAAANCVNVPEGVLAPNCGTAGCHSPPAAAANLDLASPNLESRLVGVKDSRGERLLIDPIDPEESLLYERVLGSATPRMPVGSVLDEPTTACLLTWIKSVTPKGGVGSTPSTPDGGTDAHASPAGTVVRVASGATAPYTDRAGNVWAADTSFSGGAADTHAPPVAIANTDDAPLYNTQRYGDEGGKVASFRYDFSVANGSYHVTLKFAETYLTAEGKRLFDVSINQEKKLSAFDIFKTAGGANIATDQTFDVDVSAGSVSIEFDPAGADFPKVDAIEVLPK
jgi:hypothetical protein